MLKYFVGDDTLRRGLQYYLSKHRYGNTVTKDLWDAITKVVKLTHMYSCQKHPIVTPDIDIRD